MFVVAVAVAVFVFVFSFFATFVERRTIQSEIQEGTEYTLVRFFNKKCTKLEVKKQTENDDVNEKK